MRRLNLKDFTRAAQIAALVLAAAPAVAFAQSEPPAALEEVVVTGTKRAGSISVQDAALAVTAFGESQLEKAHVDDLSDLTSLMPNVFLNSSETVHGVNNFSIRGMAVYDTIPSNTPTVGIFADGIYVGASAGSALNTFDNAAVEVLRGPQGLLFGRNVTAGAILVNTSDPTTSFRASAQASVETGLNFTESAVVSGPLNGGGTLAGKIAVYRNDDQGYFRNSFTGKSHGQSDTTILRLALAVNPGGDLRTTLRYENGRMNGDGPASQNHGEFSDDGFDFAINEPGFAKNRWQHVISDTRWKVPFGDGEVVNVLGWREVREAGLFDADGTPTTYFHFGTDIRQHQVSDELRYSGVIGPVTPTVGLYYYDDHLTYVENRALRTSNITGGGVQDSTTYAIFSNFDIALPSNLTLTFGARYSTEKKAVRVQGLVATAASPCAIRTGVCSTYNFTGNHTWNAFTPKIGLQWSPDPDTNVYAYWSKGFRSGGYNLRQTNLLAPPGPYDQEVVDTFEIGAKRDLLDGRLRINLAVFRNEFRDLQRAVIEASPIFGITQTTVNSADTNVTGFEGEVTMQVTNGLRIGGHVGYLDNDWQHFKYNLLGPGPVTPRNYDLQLPFLSPWSYGANLEYEVATRLGRLSARVVFDHRDPTPSNDANTGWLKTVNRLDVDLTLRGDNGFSYSLYAKNLNDQATTGLNNPISFTPGETIAPLNKGRIVGLEARYRY